MNLSESKQLSMKLEFELLNSANTVGYIQRNQLIDFVVLHLQNQEVIAENIGKAIDHAVGGLVNNGGLVVIARHEEELVGVLVLCKTGMEGFMPENIIFYLAIHLNQRNKLIGSELIEYAKRFSSGRIAVRVTGGLGVEGYFEKLGCEEKVIELTN